MTLPENQLARYAARAADHLEQVASKLVLPSLGEDSEHQWLSSTQVHTQADDEAGAALAALFAESFPGHGLVIEDRETQPGAGDLTWFIDPIDGSANHLRGIPYVSLTAGLLEGDEPVVGVVHDLVRRSSLMAHRGGGATRRTASHHEQVSVSSTSRLADAMAVVHLARRGPIMGREGALTRLLWSVRKIRCMGSIALDLALLAAGEIDLLVVGRGRPQRTLDILGGLILLREAGGTAVSADGHPFTLAARTLIAGPEPICSEFCALMAEDDLEAWTSDMARKPS
jgi:myo-inositol-1(or 4)-monophosphatase